MTLRHIKKVLVALPKAPGVYTLLGSQGQAVHVAYVGIADDLRGRIEQHLIRQDSSVTTGTSPVSLNPEHIREIHWWQHEAFSDRVALEAAKLVALELFEPALRSRGHTNRRAQDLYDNLEFQQALRLLFQGAPTGRAVLPDLQDALEKIEELEHRLAALEAMLAPKQ